MVKMGVYRNEFLGQILKPDWSVPEDSISHYHFWLKKSSKPATAILEQGMRYVQSKHYRHQNNPIDAALVSLLLMLNIFHTFL